jgi:hypothetical protein
MADQHLRRVVDIPKGIPGSRPLCSVDGCGRPHKARGFCSGHINTVYRQNSVLRQETRLCSVEGCGRPYYCRGLCTRCYEHLRRCGTTEKRPLRRCEFPGCSEPHEARGYCGTHYKRWQKHGDARQVVKPPRHGEHSGRWIGDSASYPVAHDRVRALHGRPSQHTCRHCGRPAEDWAYDHSDSEERTDPRGRSYSLDPVRYMPLCRKCHRNFDRPPGNPKGEQS